MTGPMADMHGWCFPAVFRFSRQNGTLRTSVFRRMLLGHRPNHGTWLLHRWAPNSGLSKDLCHESKLLLLIQRKINKHFFCRQQPWESRLEIWSEIWTQQSCSQPLQFVVITVIFCWESNSYSIYNKKTSREWLFFYFWRRFKVNLPIPS